MSYLEIYQGETILITGGAGAIGSNLARKLAESGAEKVIILDVIILMSFYTIRLIAGHIPDAIPLSPWLLSFAIFLFFN